MEVVEAFSNVHGRRGSFHGSPGSFHKLAWKSWNLPWKLPQAFLEVVEASIGFHGSRGTLATTEASTTSMKASIVSMEAPTSSYGSRLWKLPWKLHSSLPWKQAEVFREVVSTGMATAFVEVLETSRGSLYYFRGSFDERSFRGSSTQLPWKRWKLLPLPHASMEVAEASVEVVEASVEAVEASM